MQESDLSELAYMVFGLMAGAGETLFYVPRMDNGYDDAEGVISLWRRKPNRRADIEGALNAAKTRLEALVPA